MNGCINVEDFSETYMSEYEAKFSELSFREKLLVVGVFVIALLAYFPGAAYQSYKSGKIERKAKKVNEYQEMVDSLQKEYQDLTQKTGLDGIMEGHR